jgi:hypothetical protein
MVTASGDALREIDYDVHGLVGVRLVNASPREVAAVSRQIGPFRAPLGRKPDLVIRFVAQLPLSPPVRSVGADGVGFTEDGFLVLSGGRPARPRALIAFDQFDRGCEIVCVADGDDVPLLLPILNLAMLSRGALPLHASAFSYRGRGVLVTGWSGASKTGTLLAFMAQGAEFIGDDCIYARRDGRIAGAPVPLTVKAGYLQDLPGYWSRIGGTDHVRLAVLKALLALGRTLPAALGVEAAAGSQPFRLMRRIVGALERRHCVTLPPERLFGPQSCPFVGSVETLIVAISHDAPEVVVRPVEAGEVAEQLVSTLQYEQSELMSYYWRFRFAFPRRRCALIEEAEQRQRWILAAMLADRAVYALYHPYPARIPVLFQTIAPWIN